jgi:hypothetical protein
MRAALTLLALGAAAAIAACANGGALTPSGGSGGSAGHGGDGGSGAGDAGDAVPPGAVSFFRPGACPEGWSPFDAAVGRFLIPTVGKAAGGTPYGIPLASGEDRAHTHDVTGVMTLPPISFAGIAGESNHGVAIAGPVVLATTSDPASSGLPYVQFLVCKKTAAAANTRSLPSRMRLFFDAPACPPDWSQPAAPQGRFLVGLPEGADADATFGGQPHSGLDPREHVHANDGALATTPHGIALASGCCADGYAADGSYPFTADTGKGSAEMPYLELLQCESP